MEKEILNLIEKGGYLSINKYCNLHRWTSTAMEQPTDSLEAVFSITSYKDFTKNIASRDFKGIIEEIQAAQKDAFIRAYEKYNKQLENGYVI